MRNNASIELIGYVYDDPKYPMQDKYPNWIRFSLSVTRKWKNKLGEEQKEVAWYQCSSLQDGRSKIIQNYVKAGMGVLVKGTPKVTAYIDKEGNAKPQIAVNISEIFMLTPPKEGWGDNKSTSTTATATMKNKFDSELLVDDIADDDIPF
jgi:single-stranded DNA-binding protein